MTQIEVYRLIAEKRSKGIVLIVPKEGMELPSSVRVYEEIAMSPRELLITEIDGCYAFAISDITGEEKIKEAVNKIFENANITSAWDVFFYV